MLTTVSVLLDASVCIAGHHRAGLERLLRYCARHAFAFAKYAHRYLAEFQYRFNRRFDMRSILKRLLVALVHAPVCSERRLRLAEASR